jgi:hypothetical protein
MLKNPREFIQAKKEEQGIAEACSHLILKPTHYSIYSSISQNLTNLCLKFCAEQLSSWLYSPIFLWDYPLWLAILYHSPQKTSMPAFWK